MKNTFPLKVLLPLALGVIVSIAILVFSEFGYRRLDEANRTITGALEMQTRVNDVMALVTDAETGQRGFLLTGDASYLEPYRAAVANHLPIVMLSNATYPAYDAANAAGWSRAIGTDLLRHDLGFKGVTMTDSLDGTAHARGVSSASLALKAARAGTDLILLTGSQATSGAVFDALYQAAKSGSLDRTSMLASYARIRDLKAGL